MNLYMIAVRPVGDNIKLIHEIRQSFSATYNVSKALDNPAHITIIPPFHATEDQIIAISKIVSEVTPKFEKFQSHISKYGFFDKNRVVYLGIDDTRPLKKLYSAIEEAVKNAVPDVKFRYTFKYTPHITIGYRDLDRDVYKAAKDELQEKLEDISFEITEVEIWIRKEGWEIFDKTPLQ